MSSTITTGSIPRLLQEGVKKVFGNSYKSYEPIYTQLYDTDTSKKAYEVDVQMEGLGLVTEKTEGDDISFDTRRQGFAPKYVHVPYAKGFIVTREAMDDELYGQLKSGAKSLARTFAVSKEVRTHVLFNTAFSSSSAMVGGDGLSMINTAHINGPSGGTYSNRLAIDADFSEASLEDMLRLIMRATDDRGLAINLMPKRLVGHTDQLFEFERVLNSSLRSGTAENDLNAVKKLNMIPDYVVSPFLTANTKAWWLLTDAEEGLKFFDRVAMEFEEDTSFTSGDYRHKSYMRFSSGFCSFGVRILSCGWRGSQKSALTLRPFHIKRVSDNLHLNPLASQIVQGSLADILRPQQLDCCASSAAVYLYANKPRHTVKR